MTEPPPRTDAGGGCSAWRIHDAYLGEQERARAAEEAAKAKSAAAKRGAGAAAAAAAAVDGLAMQSSSLAATVLFKPRSVQLTHSSNSRRGSPEACMRASLHGKVQIGCH